jgi:predicted permease
VQVVGVMPAGFAFPWERVDVWRPPAWSRTDRAQVYFRRAHWLRAIARVRPGVSLDQADAQFQQVVRRLQVQYPETNRVMGAGMTPLHAFLVGDTRLPLLILLAAVGLLLLIACANVGNLLLVRAAGREREMAVRLALGAGRLRLVRQALTESLVLSLIGGAAGLALGWWGTRALVALQPPEMLRVREFGVDWSVLAFVVAITTASGLLFGIAPALWSSRRIPAEALREGGRTGSEGRRIRRWGDSLVIGEVALALMLTVGAGLLVRSFWQLQQVNPGFESRGVLAVSIDLPDSRYETGDKAAAFFDELLRRVRALPGVDDAGAVSQLPLTAPSWTSDFAVAGRPAGEYGTEVVHRVVTPEYLRTMRVPLLRGRGITADDRKDAPPVVLINDALARGYFAGQDPVGQRITFDRVPDSTSVWRTIVGVAGSEHQSTLAQDAQIEILAPFAQDRSSGMAVVVRTGASPASLAPAVRREVAALDANLAITSIQTMDAVRGASMARERFLMTLLVVFAIVGLALAVVGVYGVLAQLARRRTREMGIRIALGAQSSQVRWLIVRHGMRLVLVGLLIGGSLALASTRALRGLLYAVPATDPLTFAAVAALLALTGAAASLLPALRASRADPASALRAE